MSQSSFFLFQKPRRKILNFICDRCLKENCQCHKQFSEFLFSRRKGGRSKSRPKPKAKPKAKPKVKQKFKVKPTIKKKTLPQTDDYGGYGSKEAQEEALRQAIEEQIQKTPQFFPETLQKKLVQQKRLSPQIEKLIDTSQAGSLDPVADSRFAFERLYPKQTMQLIKLGQDTTSLGRSVTSIWQKLAYHDNKFKDVDQKLINLGNSIQDASKTATSALTESQKKEGGFNLGSLFGGMNTGVLIIGGIIILALVMNRE